MRHFKSKCQSTPTGPLLEFKYEKDMTVQLLDGDRLLRKRDLIGPNGILSFFKKYLERERKSGRFPEGIYISARVVVWRLRKFFATSLRAGRERPALGKSGAHCPRLATLTPCIQKNYLLSPYNVHAFTSLGLGLLIALWL